MVGSVSLKATHLVVFMHVRLFPLLTNVTTDTIATGWKNMMGNKGAVKIEFTLARKHFLFINCHLHSGQNGVQKRNNDVDQIVQTFITGGNRSRKNQVVPVAMHNRADYLVLLGDLNYRVNGFKRSILQVMQQDRYEILLQNDQLKIEMQLGNIPNYFKEGQIEFAPTFKRKPYVNN